ncbi:ABC transporter ATP-binding protein [Cetobacterium sp.]|uniref:ABC transporter ATP-binding protein n=1 Tax=Cetobacterium sp. TaxID=2071632 RepID=UPI003F3C0475
MIELKKVSKNFQDFSLKNIDIFINKGEFIGILGRSGSGKSTVLSLIAGLDKEYSGEIMIDRKPPNKIIKDGEIGMVFQKDLLLPHLNVSENIAFGLKIKKVDKKEIEKRVSLAILDMELSGKEKRFPNELSGGEKQRVSIARAIVTKPKLLLMDEPFSALDFNLREKMQKLLKKLHKKLKITIVFVTHDREEAFYLCDKIGVMFKGELLDYGTPEKLYYNPENVYTAQLLAIENIFCKEKFKKIFNCEVENYNFVALRGKSLKVVANSELKAEIKEINFKMGEYSVIVSLENENIVFVQEGNFEYKVGDTVYLEYNKKDMILIKGDENVRYTL